MGLRIRSAHPCHLWRVCGGLRRGLPQAIPTQAILAVERHRQPRGFLGTPTRPSQAADKFRSASGTDDAARGLNF